MTAEREQPRPDDGTPVDTDAQPDEDTEPASADESEGSSNPAETDDHLDDLADGAGCTEIWEHLSENRKSEE